VHYSPYDPHGGVHDGPLVTGETAMDTAFEYLFYERPGARFVYLVRCIVYRYEI
jgi:hypothetical protein